MIDIEKIYLDKNICIRCGACVSESQFGGVTFKDGKIGIDVTKREDWAEIVSICPAGALIMCKVQCNEKLVGSQ